MRRLSALICLALLCAACEGVLTGTPPPMKSVEGTTWYARAYPTGRKSTSAVLLERGAPAEVPVGQPYDYEIRVTNLTDHVLEDVVVTEFGGDGFAMNSAEPEPGSTGPARWTLGNLGPKEVKTIRVNGTNSVTGEATNRCEIDYRSLVYAKTRVVEPMLALVREAESECLVGDTFKIRYRVSNPGTGKTTGVVIQQQFAEGLAAEEIGPIQVGELAPGESRDLYQTVVPDRTGTFEVTTSASADGDLATQVEVMTLAVRKPELTLSCAAPNEWVLDRDMRCTFRVGNTGDGVARDTVVTVPLPATVRFVSADSGGRLTENEVRWMLGAIEPGAERTFTLVLNGIEAGAVRCAAAAEAHAAGRATVEVETKLIGLPALLLEVVDTQDPLAVGNEETYRITVTNTGSAPSTNLTISCALEATMEFVSSEGATPASVSGSLVSFAAVESLGRRQSVTWAVRVKAKAAGDVRFKVTLNSDQLERPVEKSESTKFFQ